MTTQKHLKTRPFNFFRVGGFDQVKFESGQDLLNLEALDQKLWVALSCPTKGLNFDTRTLELIDTDKDGRIRAPELIAALKWTGTLIQNSDDLLKRSAELALNSINSSHDEGKQILQSAQQILSSLGRANATSISVGDMAEAQKAFDAQAHNGDGVVTEDSTPNATEKQLIKEIVDCLGGLADRNGKMGVNVEKANEFFTSVAQYVEWNSMGEKDTTVLPLKGETATAFDSMKALRSKLDDFFTRCRLAAFDERSLTAMNREEKEFLSLSSKELTSATVEIQSFPLAKINAGGILPLGTGVNPAFTDALALFSSKCIKPLLGEKSSLTESEWGTLKNAFSNYENWQTKKPSAPIEKLGMERLKALALADARVPLDALLALEKAQETNAASISSVEKLVRYSRDLGRLVENFVSFKEFYQQKSPATFQAGRLFIDQRECHLCIRVDDAGKHATLAPMSRAYLIYCDVSRVGCDKMSIVAVMSQGSTDNLMVGRNAVFYDLEGKDWDATVTKIVENPISIKEAFWTPYKKLIKFVEEMISKRAASADSVATGKLTQGASHVESAATTEKKDPAAPAPVEAPKKLDFGIVAAIGIAIGGISAALGAFMQALFGLGIFMPLGLIGLLLLVSGPSMFIAWLKLRQRNIGPLLNANGWAINANAKLNIPFGTSLTKAAVIPSGSQVDKVDPFAEKPKPWGFYLTLALVFILSASWLMGKLDNYLPESVRQATVFEKL